MFKNTKKGKTNINCFIKGGNYIGFSFYYVDYPYNNIDNLNGKNRSEDCKSGYKLTK